MMRTFWAPCRSLRRRRPCTAPRARVALPVEPMGPPGRHGPERQRHHATERDAGSWRCAADRAAEIRLLEERPGSAKIEQRDGVPSQSLYLSGRIVPLTWQRARTVVSAGRRTLAGVIREGVIGEAQTGMARRALSESASCPEAGFKSRSTGPFRHPRSFAYRSGSPICRDQLPALFQECSE